MMCVRARTRLLAFIPHKMYKFRIYADRVVVEVVVVVLRKPSTVESALPQNLSECLPVLVHIGIVNKLYVNILKRRRQRI